VETGSVQPDFIRRAISVFGESPRFWRTPDKVLSVMPLEGDGMTDRQTQLLGNALDALDRLFDSDSSALDVWALLFATGEALRGSEHYVQLERPIAELLTIVRSGTSGETQRERALEVTDELRRYLAGMLPIP
jgi:hypothetical protein